MIQLIEAPPRSGKSYFAVNYLCKFVEHDDLYNEYVLKENVLIISNIEGLRIKHWKLDHVLQGKTLQEFFSIENFENIMKKTGKNHIILCIDEAHELFPADFKDKDIYNFFAYHGHIGLDIILMTQGLQSLSRMFNPLLEYIVKVTPRSRSVLNSFSYSYVDLKGRFLYSKSISKKKLVFGAYKSFRKDEVQKPKNAVLHWAVICVLFFVCAGGLFRYALAQVAEKSRGKKPVAAAPASQTFAQQNTQPSSVPIATDMPIQKPFSTVQTTPSWREYSVDAYIRDGGRDFYLIDGNFVDSVRCRNYSPRTRTVEYISIERLPDRRAISAGQAIGSSLGREASNVPAKPLGEAWTPMNLVNNDTSYKGIEKGVDIKKQYVMN